MNDLLEQLGGGFSEERENTESTKSEPVVAVDEPTKIADWQRFSFEDHVRGFMSGFVSSVIKRIRMHKVWSNDKTNTETYRVNVWDDDGIIASRILRVTKGEDGYEFEDMTPEEEESARFF